MTHFLHFSLEATVSCLAKSGTLWGHTLLGQRQVESWACNCQVSLSDFLDERVKLLIQILHVAYLRSLAQVTIDSADFIRSLETRLLLVSLWIINCSWLAVHICVSTCRSLLVSRSTIGRHVALVFFEAASMLEIVHSRECWSIAERSDRYLIILAS